MKPFVEYYRARGISPVKQDVADLARHFARRDALYRQLGIAPISLRHNRVIEFGPGSGHNALFTASLQPSAYVLVDGNPYGIAEMRALFEEHGVGDVEIVQSMIEDYASDSRYGYVFAEGLLAFSYDPPALARKVASFVESGGVLVVTCSDAVSTMGELLRRFIARRFVELDRPEAERVAVLKPIFEPHLRTLHGMSRSTEDWILDNIVHPFTGKLFALDEAIETLASDFDAYGSSPQFFVDWRWYKSIGADGDYNARAVRAYRRNVLNLLDYRFTFPPEEPAFGEAILEECSTVYELMQRSEIRNEDVGAALTGTLASLRDRVAERAPQTAAALQAACVFLRSARPSAELLEDFAPFFGRGMQYLSLIRRPGYRN